MTNEQKIEEMKNAVREVIKMIIARGEPLSEELKALLLQAIEHVTKRILELRKQDQEQPVDGLSPETELQPGPYPSSNINSFKYDYKNGNLLVKFHGQDSADSGPIYSYEGVPKFIYDTFRKGAVPPKTSGSNRYHKWIQGVTPSLGAAMYHLIRSAYPYQRLR